VICASLACNLVLILSLGDLGLDEVSTFTITRWDASDNNGVGECDTDSEWVGENDSGCDNSESVSMSTSDLDSVSGDPSHTLGSMEEKSSKESLALRRMRTFFCLILFF